MQLFAASYNKKEYEKLRNTITAGNKCGYLNSTIINKTMRDMLSEVAKSEKAVTLIHDPSELRKKYSKDLESIGKVRDLDQKIINGYGSFNTIATFGSSKKVHLMQNDVYSNRQANFLKVETIKDLANGKDFPGQESAKKLYESGKYINKKIVAQTNIREASLALKAANPQIKIEHILDREFDAIDYCDFIEKELKDKYIIRLKISRTTQSLDASKPCGKLINHPFKLSDTYTLQKVMIHNKAYQDAALQIGYEKIGKHTVIKIELKNRNKEDIFKQPMLLITNHTIDNAGQAREMYFSYLKRWRIESVFKFVKSALGWETFRLKDFNGIKTLVSIGFFLASYLYKIGDREVDEELVVFLSEIGGGKGVVSRHFMWEGIRNLLIKHKVDQAFKKYKPDKEMINNLENIAGINV